MERKREVHFGLSEKAEKQRQKERPGGGGGGKIVVQLF